MTGPAPERISQATIAGWIPLIAEAIERGEARRLVAIPKTDLHCHGLLSAPLATYERVLGRALPAPPQPFGDFNRFSEYIAEHLFPAISSPPAVRALVRGAFERLVDDGVVYAEMSFDLLLPDAIGMTPPAFAALLGEEIERIAPRVTVAPEIGLNRVLPAADIAPLFDAFLDTGVFRSIDLYGDETLGELRDFAPLYARAADRGLKRKAHAGELCGAECVREAVERLDLHAVHHGVRAVDDAGVLALLAARGTVLHVCPTSNWSLGIAPSLATHPARRLADAGITITVNTDDFTLFGASSCDELLALAAMGFSPAEIAQVIANGLAEQPQATS